MKKTLNLFSVLAATAALTLLPGCSSDEVINDPTADNPITFTITANNDSRSAEFYCNNNKPSQIYVSATYLGKPYMTNEVYKESSGVWSATGLRHYWPDDNTNPLTFYATNVKTGDNITVDWTVAGRGITYTPESSATSQKDILYAVAINKKPTKQSNSSTLYWYDATPLNFRHALSLVAFKAKNEIPHAQVTIESITINGIATSGKFIFPAAATTPNGQNHTGGAAYPAAASVGSWKNLVYPTSGRGKYFTAVPLAGTVVIPVTNRNVVNLTDLSLTNNKETNYGQTLMLIPQTRTAWNPATAQKPFAQTNAYLTVKCKIQNIAKENDTAPSASDIYIWATEDGKTKELAIPLSISWEPGKKYVYTIVFNGKGNGGYNPDGGEVLVPIKLDVNVDNFGNGGNGTIDVAP